MEGTKAEELSESDWAFVIVAAKGLPFTPLSASVLSGGRINETWRIETSEGPRVLRRYPRSRRLNQIRFELSIMAHLSQCGCKVPWPFTTDTAPIAPGTQPYSWFSYIDGRPITPQGGVTPEELASLLLPVFSTLRDFSPPFRPVAETHLFRSQVEPFLRSLPPPPAQEIAQIYDRLVHWEKRQSLPQGVIHGDIYPGNILRDKASDLWLIDFDDAHVGSRALDWVMGAAEFSFVEDRLQKNIYQTYLEALRPPFVTALEREAEPYLLGLLLLKCAINEQALGTLYEKNRYLALLLQGELRL